MRKCLLLTCVATLALPALAHAHYLWVLVKPEGDQQVVDVVFEESSRRGDGHYLAPIVERGTTWARSADQPEPRKLNMREVREEEFRWLRGTTSADGPVAVESYVKWGVYRYGDTDALLHYYAKYLGPEIGEKPLRKAAKLDLDIVVSRLEGENNVQVLWQGKPVAMRPIEVRGPRSKRLRVTTDEQGRATLPFVQPGLHTLRTSVMEDQSGSFDGKDYTQVRHNATLILRVLES